MLPSYRIRTYVVGRVQETKSHGAVHVQYMPIEIGLSSIFTDAHVHVPQCGVHIIIILISCLMTINVKHSLSFCMINSIIYYTFGRRNYHTNNTAER